VERERTFSKEVDKTPQAGIIKNRWEEKAGKPEADHRKTLF